MDKASELVTLPKRTKSGRDLILSIDAVNLHEYLWRLSQENKQSNEESILMYIRCRSKVWYGLFYTIVHQSGLSDEQLLSALHGGIFVYLVPMEIARHIAKVDSKLAREIVPSPPEGQYNLVFLDDDKCSVHLIEPERPTMSG